MSAGDFVFHHEWSLPGPPGPVVEALADIEHYPTWWPQVRQVHRIDDHSGRAVVRSVLPLTLRLVLTRETEDREGGRLGVRIDGDLVDVTTKEFDLLATLVSHADETLPREDLITAVWSGGEVPDERTVDVHIRRLRRRLGEYASVVRTMRGSGYRYDTHPDVTVWSATARR